MIGYCLYTKKEILMKTKSEEKVKKNKKDEKVKLVLSEEAKEWLQSQQGQDKELRASCVRVTTTFCGEGGALICVLTWQL